MTDTYDVVVIGAGSGGMAAAKRAASRNADVALVEEQTVGGTCVARGCMPKKFLYYAAERMHEIQAAGPAGLESEATDVRWSDIIEHEQSIVEDLIASNRDGVEQYDCIDLIEGHATLESRDRVTVGDRTLSAETIILATGASPSRPPIDGAQYGVTSDEFLRDHTLPYSMAIVGGGYISVEFAAILNTFGVEVAIFQRPDQLLPEYDADLAGCLEEQFRDRGISVNTNHEVSSIEKSGRSYVLRFSGDDTGSYAAERVLLATGREPNTGDLGLENVGLETTEEGAIDVDGTMRTDVDSIFAVGDLNRHLPFTPVAIREGKIAAENALTDGREIINYQAIPSAVFTRPQIGSVGVSEGEARGRHDTVQVAEKRFKPFSAAVHREGGEVYIKLIYVGEERRLEGLYVLGPNAPEIVQGFALAIRQGVTQEDLKEFPGIHPTVAEEVFSTKPE